MFSIQLEVHKGVLSGKPPQCKFKGNIFLIFGFTYRREFHLPRRKTFRLSFPALHRARQICLSGVVNPVGEAGLAGSVLPVFAQECLEPRYEVQFGLSPKPVGGG